MKKSIILVFVLVLITSYSFAQSDHFEKLNFLLGEWNGTGEGFNREKSTIESSFQLVMDGNYIEVRNESKFEPNEKIPKGGYHLDKGFISYDKDRNSIVLRQFNNKGFINQSILDVAVSSDSLLIFNTETIENFVPGGKARWTIKRISDTEIETSFYVSIPEQEFVCFETNKLQKKME